MRSFILACLLALAAPVFADTLVLNPGDMSQYLPQSCGGRQWNETALGFQDSNAVTELTVTTTCATGTGRLRKTHVYSACWVLTYDRSGLIVDAYVCPGPEDLAYQDEDGAVLETVFISDRSRVVLETP
jgi:hypothetical protein